MKQDNKDIRVVFRHDKKKDSEQHLHGAFDLLFEEVFRAMNGNKSIMATN